MRYFITFLLALSLLTACSRDDSQVVAKVGEKVLTLNDLKSFYTESEWETVTNEEKRKVVRNWMDLQALAKYADEKKLSDEDAVKIKMDVAINKAKANALLASEINKIRITEDELFNYYKIHQGEYKSKIEAFKVQRIYVKSDTLLATVQERLKSKENFTELAKEYSQERIGSSGGYLGWVNEKDEDLTMFNSVKNLKLYQYNTINANNGYYIVRYYKRKQIDVDVRYESIKEELRDKLFNEKKEKIYNELLRSLKNSYDMSLSF